MAEQALQQRLSQLDSDALLAMWKEQERAPWAEEILKGELLARGFSPKDLDQATLGRSSTQNRPPSAQETFFWYGFVARVGAFVGAMITSNIVGSLINVKAGLLAALAVIGVYVYFLIRRLLSHASSPSSAGASIVIAL